MLCGIASRHVLKKIFLIEGKTLHVVHFQLGPNKLFFIFLLTLWNCTYTRTLYILLCFTHIIKKI